MTHISVDPYALIKPMYAQLRANPAFAPRARQSVSQAVSSRDRALASDGRILALAPVPGAAANISLNVLVDWQAALRR
jgi:hypothetical protein